MDELLKMIDRITSVNDARAVWMHAGARFETLSMIEKMGASVDKLRDEIRLEVVYDLQNSGKLQQPKAATMAQLLAGVTAPAWVDPAGDVSLMYSPGDVVTHGGNVYSSTFKGLNSATPGADLEKWALLANPGENVVEVEIGE